MRTVLLCILSFVLTAVPVAPAANTVGSPAQPSLPAPKRGFVSSQPARTWEHALVTGNGKYGAMVYGEPLEETIIFNHARLFMPLHPPLPPVDTASHLAEIRQMFAEGKYQRAADFVVELSRKENFGGKRWTDPFIPAFDLKLTVPQQGETKDYARTVDFSTAVASVHWADDRGTFMRRVFASRADDLVAVSLKHTGTGNINCRIQLATRPTQGQGGWWPEEMFNRGIKEVSIAAEPGRKGECWLTYRSGFRQSWPGSLQGYEGVARVIAKGGEARGNEGVVQVTDADEVLVLVRMGLLNDFSRSQVEDLKDGLARVRVDFDDLLGRHAKIHGGMFNRSRLDLGGGADHNRTSEELIAGSKVGNLSKALLEKEYDACRYAVLCSSGELFPNLQGIWNGTWGPPWSADFTQNGNVQSAIAADLSGNLAECLEPYFKYQEDFLEQSRANAKRLYGTRGIHVASRTSSHGLNNHFDGTWPMTFWTAGAGWASHFFYDYYLYTGDREFLRKRALPFMKQSAVFYEDFLFDGPDGKLVFSPSYSPENNPKNNPSQACINATMDVAIAKELLNNCIAACETLKTEAGLVKKWRGMLAKMPEYEINEDGALKEWTTPLLADNYQHRHCSHLYPLFDGMPPDIAGNPVLQKAFRVAAEKRMAFRRSEHGGEMAFGLVQLGQAVSSLRDAGMSYEVVDWLANNFWYPNMVTTHNPKSLFNTDLCGGLPAVIIKMLADSRPGSIEILPGLPGQWPSGRIEGIRCRGQVEIRKLEWNGRQIELTLRSDIRQQVKITVPGGFQSAASGKSREQAVAEDGSCSVSLPARKDFSLRLERASEAQ